MMSEYPESPTEHQLAAEHLLAEGVRTVDRISELARQRDNVEDPYVRQIFTAQMDELGKKAMGIWAQAQVHATLSTRDS